jgi:hypothetical protein
MHLWVLALLLASPATEFRDDFDVVRTDPAGARGWRFLTGDGAATMTLRQGGPGYASIEVDATRDRRGIWWALIERNVSDNMDLGLLRGREVRIEARLRVSHAPRRVNLQVLTARSTDDYAHLMEFDIADSGTWHTISMTTRGFQARPGDTLIGHLALMDWGLEKYRVDLDYVRVGLVDPATAGPDQGAAVPYHPPLADPKTFRESLPPAEAAMIDLENAATNFDDWSMAEAGRRLPLLTVDAGHVVLLRWDLRQLARRHVAAAGLLELTTHTVAGKAAPPKDFGLLRVVEILGGDRGWTRRTATAESFFRGEPPSRVLNPQMIIDWPATEGNGGKTYLTIPAPVLQRLLDGKTHGIAIKPLGALSASFYASARLLLNLDQPRSSSDKGR